MKRRDFLKTTATTVAAGSVLVGCGSSGDSSGPAIQAQPTVRWQLASSYSHTVDVLYGATRQVADRVSSLTNGRFTIRSFQAGEIVPGLEVLEAVQKGTVQLGQSASYYYTGKNPALAFDTGVPFGLTARQHNAWMYHGGGLELMREAFADFNVINLPMGNTGAQMGGWFRREINSLGDLRGLKMRIPGMGGEVMNELGVTVQVLSAGEIYTALERGAIDAAEWVGPYDDVKLGFGEIAKHYYYPGWWEPGASIALFVNQDAWNQLPTTYQEALVTAAAEANATMLARYDAKNTEALPNVLSQDVALRPFSDDIMQAAQQTATAILEDRAARNPSFNKVYTAFKTWRSESQQWFGTAEQAFTSFAFNS